MLGMGMMSEEVVDARGVIAVEDVEDLDGLQSGLVGKFELLGCRLQKAYDLLFEYHPYYSLITDS